MTTPRELQPFLSGFAFVDRSIDLATDNLTEGDALHRLRNGEGPSILWTLGHLYEYRGRVLASLDVKVEGTYWEMFCKTPASDGAGYPTLEEMKQMWVIRATALQEALASIGPDALIDGEGEQTPLYKGLVFHNFHEASHMGTTNLIRKELGHRSAAEIVMARMKAEAEAAEQ